MTDVSARALDAAVMRGVLSADQAEQLRGVERELGERELGMPPIADDEALRFVSGFADVFVTIGVLLFVGALAFIMGAQAGSTPMLAGIAASTWLLAEFFTGKRRMALPSIVLLVLFVGAVLWLSLQVFTALLPTARTLPERFWFIPTPNALALAASAVVTAGLAAMHYIRFRVPITVAVGAAALCLLVLGATAALVPEINETAVNIVLFVCGLLVFALAMRFDTSDPQRMTRRTDIAFWLHLLAAPLIVHTLIRTVLHGNSPQLSPGAAVVILWIFIVLGFVAVVIDRRAIMVSGLVYVGIAFGTLFQALGFGEGSRFTLPSVLLALGAFILLLSAGWQPLRRALLRRLPQTIAARLPRASLVSQT